MSGATASLPATLDEAVRVVVSGMDERSKTALRSMAREDLITLHHGLGTAIRNQLGLWGENPALIAACRTFDRFEPDAASQVILGRVWAVLAVDPEPSDASRTLEAELASASAQESAEGRRHADAIRARLAQRALAERRWDAAEVLVQAMLEHAALEGNVARAGEAERLRIELWIESGRRVPEGLDAVRASIEGRAPIARLELWGWMGRAGELQGDELQCEYALSCMRTLVTNEHGTAARDAVRGFYALPPRLLDRPPAYPRRRDPPNGSPAPGPSVRAARSRAVPARASTLPVDPPLVELAHGIVDRAELVDESGGAHPRGPLSEVLFGPRRDLACACGACSGFRMAGRRCPRCQVEVLPSITRTLRCAEVRMSIPLLHPGYLHVVGEQLAQTLGIDVGEARAIALHETYLPDTVPRPYGMPRTWTGPTALLHLAQNAQMTSEHPEAYLELDNASIARVWVPPPDATLDLGDGVRFAHAPFRAALGALLAAEESMKLALHEPVWTEAWRRPASALSHALDAVYWAARGTSG